MNAMKLLAGIVCAAIGAAAFAKDVYVDNRSPAASDAATEGRGTESLPYLTIQAAIDAETTEAGDTIKVKPGIYATGGRVNESEVIVSQVVIDKAVDVVSTGGRKVTEIVGQFDPSTGSYGEGAIRCVRVTANAAGKRLEGFTLRNGGTKNEAWTADGSGGGVYARSDFYVVGCAIVNCRAGMGGGAHYGIAVRCLFFGCNSGQSSALSSAMRGGTAVSCVFDSNGGCATRGTTLVNCTFVNNSATAVSGNSKAYNCLSVGATTDFEGSITQQNCVDTASAGSKYVVMSPGSGDYRPVAGSAAIGAGVSAIETLGLPADMCGKDFDGNPLPTTGTVDVGAVQGGASPGSGRIDLASTSATYKQFIIDGHPSSAGDWLQAEAYPAQWLVHPESSTNAATSFCMGVKWRPDSSGRLVPDMAGNVGLMPPPSDSYTATAMYSAKALYVSDADGSDDDGDGTAAHPYKTIQKAIDKASSDYVIHVAEGDYDSNYAVAGSATNRINVNKTVLIRGAGAGRSVLWGAADPTTGGDGTGAIRAFYGYSAYASIQGFTIRDSWAAGQANTFSGLGSGTAEGGFHVADCIFTNCTGGTTSLFENMTLERCRIVGNRAVYTDGARLAACLFEANTTPSGSNKGLIGFYSHCRNCTFIGASGSPIAGGISGPSGVVRTFKNCILDTSSQIHKNITGFYGCIFWNLGSRADLPSSGFVIADPIYADPSRGDRRVYDFSVATTCGDGTSESDATAYQFLSTGLDGKIQSYKESKPVVGAYFGAVTGGYAYISAANGGIAVGGGSVGGNVFDAERTITLSATNATRPCIGYAVNGVTNLFDETPAMVIDAVAAAPGLRIDAIYTSDWYVDAENGDDAFSGYTPGSAKRTLVAATTNALLTAGDTVHAAPGDYNDGEFIIEGASTKNRVVVPAGVTLVADEVPAATFITGANAPSGSANGCGAGATRCVGEGGGVVRGFTLRGGRAHVYPNGTWDDWHGSAVNRSTIEDCVVTNCAGYGTCSISTVCRCRVVDNSGSAGGAYNCTVYDTIFDRNGNTDWIVSCNRIIGCTIGKTGVGTTAPLNVGSASYVVSNCIVLCASTFAAGVAAPGTYFAVAPTVADGGPLPAGATLTDADHLKLDENWMPVYGENVAIDVLDKKWANAEGRDATGGQRVYNGLLDAGAVEYDFRKRIPSLLRAGKSFEVMAASPDVVEDASPGVCINSGRVDARWCFTRTVDRRYSAAVSVSGGGTLTVYVNGEVYGVYGESDGRVNVFFENQLAENGVSFVYAPDSENVGYAKIDNAVATGDGIILIVL